MVNSEYLLFFCNLRNIITPQSQPNLSITGSYKKIQPELKELNLLLTGKIQAKIKIRPYKINFKEVNNILGEHVFSKGKIKTLKSLKTNCFILRYFKLSFQVLVYYQHSLPNIRITSKWTQKDTYCAAPSLRRLSLLSSSRTSEEENNVKDVKIQMFSRRQTWRNFSGFLDWIFRKPGFARLVFGCTAYVEILKMYTNRC